MPIKIQTKYKIYILLVCRLLSQFFINFLYSNTLVFILFLISLCFGSWFFHYPRMTARTQIATLNYCHTHQIKSPLIHAVLKLNLHKLPFCCRLWSLSMSGCCWECHFPVLIFIWIHLFKAKNNKFRVQFWFTSFLQLLTSGFWSLERSIQLTLVLSALSAVSCQTSNPLSPGNCF